MKRRAFIKNCGFGCVKALALGVALESCVSMKSISGVLDGENLRIPMFNFLREKNGLVTYRPYLVVQNPKLQYPICLYRFDNENYTALYLQCTHQGNQLDVFGDKLVCSAHGSEFDNKGAVLSGPADTHLQSFPISLTNEEIIISLKLA